MHVSIAFYALPGEYNRRLREHFDEPIDHCAPVCGDWVYHVTSQGNIAQLAHYCALTPYRTHAVSLPSQPAEVADAIRLAFYTGKFDIRRTIRWYLRGCPGIQPFDCVRFSRDAAHHAGLPVSDSAISAWRLSQELLRARSAQCAQAAQAFRPDAERADAGTVGEADRRP